MRRCECFDGWAGADCSQGAGGGKSVPPWAIALIVLSSSALAGILIIAAGYALQALGVTPGSPGGRWQGAGSGHSHKSTAHPWKGSAPSGLDRVCTLAGPDRVCTPADPTCCSGQRRR